MTNRALFLLQAIVISVVGAVHVSALEYSLYWHYIWLDLPVHFLGGMWIALISAWLISYHGWPITYKLVMATVLLVGLGWELFEVAAGVPMESNFAFDTTLDFIMDITGGTLGYFIARKLTS